jgi:hypothetical protein
VHLCGRFASAVKHSLLNVVSALWPKGEHTKSAPRPRPSTCASPPQTGQRTCRGAAPSGRRNRGHMSPPARHTSPNAAWHIKNARAGRRRNFHRSTKQRGVSGGYSESRPSSKKSHIPKKSGNSRNWPTRSNRLGPKTGTCVCPKQITRVLVIFHRIARLPNKRAQTKGQVMKLSKGKSNPAVVGEILQRKLRNRRDKASTYASYGPKAR